MKPCRVEPSLVRTLLAAMDKAIRAASARGPTAGPDRPLRPFEVHFALVFGNSVYVLDAAWPECKVGVEIIGRAHRLASLSAFDRERRKLNALGMAGWKICHLTAAMSPRDMAMAARAMLAEGAGRRRVHL